MVWQAVDVQHFLQLAGMHEGSMRSNEAGGLLQSDLPTEEELEEGIKAVQAAVAAAEHEEALQQPSEPLQDPHIPSGRSFAHDVLRWSLHLAHLKVWDADLVWESKGHCCTNCALCIGLQVSLLG
jgi:hypothetical protein